MKAHGINPLERDFRATRPNQKQVSDITHVSTGKGWSMGERQNGELVIRTVMAAPGQRDGGAPTLLHSDRGSHVTSEDYLVFRQRHGLVSSMSAVVSCADNAAAEGMFTRLERERVNRRSYPTRQEARADVFDYIERQNHADRRRSLSRCGLIQAAREIGVEPNGLFYPAVALLFWYCLPAYRQADEETGCWDLASGS